MKTPTLVSLFVLTGALVAVGAYQLGVHRNPLTPMATAPESPMAPVANVDPKTGRAVLYWHDPMVPGTRFDMPGKSPFMDMQLVPVYADQSAGAGRPSARRWHKVSVSGWRWCVRPVCLRASTLWALWRRTNAQRKSYRRVSPLTSKSCT
ncbi:MAG: hypothetical protein IPK34_10255 [Ramlibacter sp.]|nr:hypothetical protein [Ramlibacter sp.]